MMINKKQNKQYINRNVCKDETEHNTQFKQKFLSFENRTYKHALRCASFSAKQ